MTGTDDDRVWERGWKGHEVAQLQRLARLTLAEKLRWLEEAARVVEEVTAGRVDKVANPIKVANRL